MEQYTAIFGIDGGASPGFGVKYPDYMEKDEAIAAVDAADALRQAYDLARTFSRDHLSNPETGLTSVKILSIKDKGHNPINLRLYATEKMEIEDGHITVKCSMLEHILALQ